MMNTAYQNRAKENHKEKNDNYARMFALTFMFTTITMV